MADETGAGDSFRAAFCVALAERLVRKGAPPPRSTAGSAAARRRGVSPPARLRPPGRGALAPPPDPQVEGRPLQQALQLAGTPRCLLTPPDAWRRRRSSYSRGRARLGAAAEGAIAVSRVGAIPSLPYRQEAEELARGAEAGTTADACFNHPPPLADVAPGAALTCKGVAELQFASRLNSMKDRRDLVSDPRHTNDVLGWWKKPAPSRLFEDPAPSARMEAMGSRRSCACRRAASVAWRRAVASAARLSCRRRDGGSLSAHRSSAGWRGRAQSRG